MSRVIRSFILILGLAAVAFLPACRSARIKNPDPVRAAATESATRDAIVAACDSENWMITKEEPGEIHAKCMVRGKHELSVVIRYTSDDVRVEYEGSHHLDYSKDWFGHESIHKNGNSWMKNLSWAIRQKIENRKYDRGAS